MGPSSFSSPVLKTTKWREQATTICQLYLTRCILGMFNIENFQREKVIVDQICKLSSEEMELLRANDRNAVMNLRLECPNYGSNPPSRKPGKQVCGAPENLISKSVLEGYLEEIGRAHV